MRPNLLACQLMLSGSSCQLPIDHAGLLLSAKDQPAHQLCLHRILPTFAIAMLATATIVSSEGGSTEFTSLFRTIFIARLICHTKAGLARKRCKSMVNNEPHASTT